jgi:hypothetical protein
MPAPRRFFLGSFLLAFLFGLGLYGAFCVNVQTAPPTPVSTLVVVQPASPSPTVYVFATMTPLPERLPAVPTATPVPEVLILDAPLPTATPPPMLVLPPPTNTRLPIQKG